MRKMLTFLIGLVIGASVFGPLGTVAKEKYDELQVFAKVLNLVQQYYVEKVDSKKLIYGGVKGILVELDPHSSFLPPDAMAEFENETAGEFGGLGIEMSIQNGVLTVIAPIEDSPAYKAGIKGGDKIVSINGEATKGFTMIDAAQRMKSDKHKQVKLGIYREGFSEPKEFLITKETIKIKSVKYTDFEDGYAYLRLTSFIEKTSGDLQNILNAHVKKHKKISGIILDLRNNPGGLLEQSIKISDMFLNDGIIVSTIGRNKDVKEVVHAKKEGTLSHFPLIVLINEYSASASEILAGALQDNKRGLVMGQRSFGKGSVQSIVKLGDGSGLKLTVARYYTPSGASIQAEGIRPDIEIPEVDPELFQKAVTKRATRRESDIKGHLLGDKEREQLTKNNVNKLWYLNGSKEEKKLSERDQLLKKDFQVLQAFNYVKSLSSMRPEFKSPQASN